LSGPRILGTESVSAGSGLRILPDETEDRPGPLVPETAFRDPDPPGHKLDGAIMELRALLRRMEFTGAGIDRLPSVRIALRYLKVAARIDSVRCLRAVVKAMTLWKTDAAVKMDMHDLFSALSGSLKMEVDDDDLD